MSKPVKEIDPSQLALIETIRELTNRIKEVKTDYNRLRRGKKEVFGSFGICNPKRTNRKEIDEIFELLINGYKNNIQTLVRG